jgi:hypothetical protein
MFKHFHISEIDQKYIQLFKDAIDAEARYQIDPTDLNMDKKLTLVNICVKQLLLINKNDTLKNRYETLLESNITNKETIWMSLYDIAKRLMNDTGMVYKLIPVMIMNSIERLLKRFAIYVLICSLSMFCLMFVLSHYQIDFHLSIPYWIFTMIVCFVPMEFIEFKFLYQNIKLYFLYKDKIML